MVYLIIRIIECGSFAFWAAVGFAQKTNVPHGGEVFEMKLMCVCMLVVFKC
jgi:hypothetical protein